MTMTTASLAAGSHEAGVAEDPAARPRRRTFATAYKGGLLVENDALASGGSERGASPRRDGLSTSHVAEGPVAFVLVTGDAST